MAIQFSGACYPLVGSRPQLQLAGSVRHVGPPGLHLEADTQNCATQSRAALAATGKP
ncbi:hypothetical protein P7K49_039303, partial [Saguinus oedipus]